MFTVVKKETDVANLVVRTKTVETNRHTVFGTGMHGTCGRIQREGEVVDFVTRT